MQKPFLIIITGLPCTGKTTLARKLARLLSLPLIAKDDIKECLFDSLGWSDREWSKRLGRATFDLLFAIVEEELSAGRSLMTEALFYPQFHRQIFLEIHERHPFRPFVIECVADGDMLRSRFHRRIVSGERHPGHVDHLAYTEFEEMLLRGRLAPLDLGGIEYTLDTTDFAMIGEGKLLSALREALEREN